MQRMYDVPRKKKTDTAEFFELRENSPQERLQLEVKPPTFKIPSSSNMIAANNNKNYKSSTQAYSQNDSPTNEPPIQQTSYMSPRSLHCIVIADHIMDCPICSRFYRNYTPFYNIILMILLIIVIFLFIRCQKLALLSSRPAMA